MYYTSIKYILNSMIIINVTLYTEKKYHVYSKHNQYIFNSNNGMWWNLKKNVYMGAQPDFFLSVIKNISAGPKMKKNTSFSDTILLYGRTHIHFRCNITSSFIITYPKSYRQAIYGFSVTLSCIHIITETVYTHRRKIHFYYIMFFWKMYLF